jgi:hypothetical protein
MVENQYFVDGHLHGDAHAMTVFAPLCEKQW